MRKTAVALALSLFLAVWTYQANAASLAGVTLPDTAQAGGKTLALNGLGLRSKMMVKVYVGGLYLPQKSSDANSILKSDAPKQVVMKFTHAVSKSQMVDGFAEGIGDNSPNAKKTMQPDIDKLLGALDSVNVGDQMVFTYIPGTGTILTINGKDNVTIAGAEFSPVIFSVWLGPKPPNADLKKGMLGQ